MQTYKKEQYGSMNLEVRKMTQLPTVMWNSNQNEMNFTKCKTKSLKVSTIVVLLGFFEISTILTFENRRANELFVIVVQ